MRDRGLRCWCWSRTATCGASTRTTSRWLRERRHVWADLLAGLAIAGLLLPEAVAYAGIAGLPPQAGVMALFAGLVCYGVLGSSRYAIVSATSSSAAVLAAGTLALEGGDPASRTAIVAGLV